MESLVQSKSSPSFGGELSDHINHHSGTCNTRKQDGLRCLNSFENKIKSIRNCGKRLENILKSRLVRMRSPVQIWLAAPKSRVSKEIRDFLYSKVIDFRGQFLRKAPITA